MRTMSWFRPSSRMSRSSTASRETGPAASPSWAPGTIGCWPRRPEKTIAVVEELVEPGEVLPGLQEVYVAPVHIDAVVVAPGGAHPTECPGRYEIDAGHIMTYLTAAKDEASFQNYLETYITGPADHEAYLKKVGFRTPDAT